MTISRYNSYLSNLSFEKKRDREEKGKHIGYKNGLYLNKELATKNDWQIKDIEKRTKKLTQTALKLFALDEEVVVNT